MSTFNMYFVLKPSCKYIVFLLAEVFAKQELRMIYFIVHLVIVS